MKRTEKNKQNCTATGPWTSESWPSPFPHGSPGPQGSRISTRSSDDYLIPDDSVGCQSSTIRNQIIQIINDNLNDNQWISMIININDGWLWISMIINNQSILSDNHHITNNHDNENEEWNKTGPSCASPSLRHICLQWMPGESGYLLLWLLNAASTTWFETKGTENRKQTEETWNTQRETQVTHSHWVTPLKSEVENFGTKRMASRGWRQMREIMTHGKGWQGHGDKRDVDRKRWSC